MTNRSRNFLSSIFSNSVTQRYLQNMGTLHNSVLSPMCFPSIIALRQHGLSLCVFGSWAVVDALIFKILVETIVSRFSTHMAKKQNWCFVHYFRNCLLICYSFVVLVKNDQFQASKHWNYKFLRMQYTKWLLTVKPDEHVFVSYQRSTLSPFYTLSPVSLNLWRCWCLVLLHCKRYMDSSLEAHIHLWKGLAWSVDPKLFLLKSWSAWL